MSDYWAPRPPGPGVTAAVPYAAPSRPDNRWAWCLALTPLVYVGLQAVLGATELDSTSYRWGVLALSLLINTVLVRADVVRIRQAEVRLGGLVCFCFFVPLYLLVRAARDSRTYAMLAVWVAAFALTLPSVGLVHDVLGVRIKGEVVERHVEARAWSDLNLSIAVDCPNHPRVKVGETFRCRVVGLPLSARFVEVRLTSRQGQFLGCLIERGPTHEGRQCFH